MAELTLMKNAAEQQIAAEWQTAKEKLPGVAPLRAAAFERFAATGLPHRRVEAWKYTDLRALLREAAPLAPAPGPAEKAAAQKLASPVARIEAIRLVLVDGAFAPELSASPSVSSSLAQAPAGMALRASGRLSVSRAMSCSWARSNIGRACRRGAVRS